MTTSIVRIILYDPPPPPVIGVYDIAYSDAASVYVSSVIKPNGTCATYRSANDMLSWVKDNDDLGGKLATFGPQFVCLPLGTVAAEQRRLYFSLGDGTWSVVGVGNMQELGQYLDFDMFHGEAFGIYGKYASGGCIGSTPIDASPNFSFHRSCIADILSGSPELVDSGIVMHSADGRTTAGFPLVSATAPYPPSLTFPSPAPPVIYTSYPFEAPTHVTYRWKRRMFAEKNVGTRILTNNIGDSSVSGYVLNVATGNYATIPIGTVDGNPSLIANNYDVPGTWVIVGDTASADGAASTIDGGASWNNSHSAPWDVGSGNAIPIDLQYIDLSTQSTPKSGYLVITMNHFGPLLIPYVAIYYTTNNASTWTQTTQSAAYPYDIYLLKMAVGKDPGWVADPGTALRKQNAIFVGYKVDHPVGFPPVANGFLDFAFDLNCGGELTLDGTAWSSIPDKTVPPLFDIAFLPSKGSDPDIYLALGKYNTLLRSVNLGCAWITLAQDPIFADTELVAIRNFGNSAFNVIDRDGNIYESTVGTPGTWSLKYEEPFQVLDGSHRNAGAIYNHPLSGIYSFGNWYGPLPPRFVTPKYIFQTMSGAS